MAISDIIEAYLKELIRHSQEVQIKRSDLAEKFNCVPSQINYVISTRFTTANGFSVESKRGGGGGITIRKLDCNEGEYLSILVQNIGTALRQHDGFLYIKNLFERKLITQREANIMFAAVSDNSLPVEPVHKDKIRAKILKNMIINMTRS